MLKSHQATPTAGRSSLPRADESPADQESPMAKSDKSDRADKSDKHEKSHEKNGDAKKAPPQAAHAKPEATIIHDPARDSALSRAVQQIEKQFGKGAVMKLDGNARTHIDGIPTGSLSLD